MTEGAIQEARRMAVAIISESDLDDDTREYVANVIESLCFEVETLQKDKELLNWVEANLCFAADIRNAAGQVTGIAKGWQIVTQLDEGLRETVGRLRAALETENG